MWGKAEKSSKIGSCGGMVVRRVFIIKWVWGRFSSHDEGPASTARFTGGQVIRRFTQNKLQKIIL